MGKESFLIYKSFYKPISKLSDKQLGRLFRAIFKYQLGEIITVEEDIEIAFEFFKNQFEIDENKYHGIVERNRSNGSKGGAPKRAKNDNSDDIGTTQINPNNPVGFSEPKKADNDNDKDNDNVNDNDTDNDNEKEPQKNSGGGRFEEFWREYPKKQNVVRARKAFEFLAPDGDTFEKIMQSVRHFKKSENWQKEGGRYIPSPANFLLDRRFEDVPESEIEEHEPCYDLDEYLKRRFGDYIRKPE